MTIGQKVYTEFGWVTITGKRFSPVSNAVVFYGPDMNGVVHDVTRDMIMTPPVEPTEEKKDLTSMIVKGLKIRRGLKGEKGDRGYTGFKGEKGDSIVGPKGEKGDKGEPGDDGKDGKNGKDGKDGKKGERGERGLTGPKGKDGKDGKDGLNGLNGLNGGGGIHKIDDATDVKITNPTDNQSLTYDSATGKWVNETVSGGSGGSVDTIVAGNNISVDATDPANPIVSATIEPYYIYVAANDATTREKAIADYLCDGTADQVQINLAIEDVRATGGKVILSSGNFAIAASIDLTGDVAEDDGNPAITLIGSGIEGTVLTGGSNIDVITTGQRAKFELAYMTIKASGSGDCLSQTAGTERGNWQSFVHDLYLQGNFSDHSGWGINMESPFRMRFANIEMNGVANGLNLKCHTESFNPGNLSLDRVFIDLWNDASNASAVGLRLAVTSSSSTGVMNLVSVNRLDIAGGSNLTSSIGIEIVGASASYGDSRHHTFNSLNIEDVKTAIKFTRGRDCTFTDLNYVRVLGSGKIIELDSTSHNNSFENLYAVGTTSTTFDLITDANSSSALPNRLTRVDGYQPASVTINATLAANTILEHIDLSGGSPTIDVDITNRNNNRTFAGLNVTGLTASEMVITDASKNLVSAAVATYPSLTELAYVKGLTSSAQTQLTARLPIAGGTMTGNITLGENTSIALDPAGSADGKYSGITVAGTAGATLAFGDLIYLDPTDSRWELADANAAAAADGDARGLLGICVLAAASDGSATTVLLQGIVRADTAFPTMTIGAPLYVSETAGDVVVAQPTTTDVVIRIVGVAMTADEMFFRPDFTWVTHT